MLNGSTYIVRPRIEPSNNSLSLRRIWKGSSQLLVGPAASLRERADEGAVFDPRDVARVGAGVVTARPEFLVELDEAAALDHLAQSASYSSCEPSTQWMAAGCVSRAIFSTHLRRWAFLLRGTAGALLSWKGLMPFAFPSPIASQSLGNPAVPGRGRRDRRPFTAANSPATTCAPSAAGPTPARRRDRGAAALPAGPRRDRHLEQVYAAAKQKNADDHHRDQLKDVILKRHLVDRPERDQSQGDEQPSGDFARPEYHDFSLRRWPRSRATRQSG